jgi:hypothetical protein
LSQPLRIGTALAVIRNPFAGRYEPDLLAFQAGVCTENLIRVDDVIESPKLAE